MKMFIAFASFMALNALAAGDLGEMKRTALDKIGRDMTTLQSNKNCISGSKTIEEFNNCNYSVGPSMPMQKQETKMMDKKSNMKDQSGY